MSPRVTEEAVRRAFKDYAKARFNLPNVEPTELELKGMSAALKGLAEDDRARTKVLSRGGTGTLTVMIFDGDDAIAIGEALSQGEAQDFIEDLWGARLTGEFPLDVEN